CSVLSGNRNFEGRVNPDVRANYLASPPLVVAYAIAGSLRIDLTKDPLGHDPKGAPVYLKDIWPSSIEVADVVRDSVNKAMFRERYSDVFRGGAKWRKIKVEGGMNYRWDPKSTYVQHPPYFQDMSTEPVKQGNVQDARILGMFLDSITTDHISPAGSIAKTSPAGQFLIAKGVTPAEFNS